MEVRVETYHVRNTVVSAHQDGWAQDVEVGKGEGKVTYNNTKNCCLEECSPFAHLPKHTFYGNSNELSLTLQFLTKITSSSTIPTKSSTTTSGSMCPLRLQMSLLLLSVCG